MREADMWVIGTVIVLIVGAAVTAALGWTPRVSPGPPMWDTAKLGVSNTSAVGTFAGFSLTSAIFIAGLDVARSSSAFATVFGMMLIGFLILVIATWIAGSTPSVPQAEGMTVQSLALLLGNLCANLGVSITWLALVPLMVVIGLPTLASVFIWALLIMALVAGGWVALFTCRLTMASPRACSAVPVLGMALPALYRLVAVRLWPALWPAREAALLFAFVALAAAGLMFALYMGLLAANGNTPVQERLRRDSHWMVLAASQAYVAVVGLIWFAVALP
jgi:hypothetical protein